MGKFEENIPKAIDEIDGKINRLEWSKRDINEYGHDCDCEFCDRDGEGADEDAPEKLAKIDQEIADMKLARRRLIDHAETHGIKYTKPVQKARS